MSNGDVLPVNTVLGRTGITPGPAEAIPFATLSGLLGITGPGVGRQTLTGPTATFYVSPTGNDSTGDGSIGLPWRTPQHAINQIITTYDFDGALVIIQLANGTYSIGSGSSGLLVPGLPVGGYASQGPGAPNSGSSPTIILLGNQGAPASVIIDGTSSATGSGVYMPENCNAWVHVEGIQFQNWTAPAINNQSFGGLVTIGNVNFTGNKVCMEAEGGGSIVSGNKLGGGAATITVSGTNDQLAFAATASKVDFNNAAIIFSAATFLTCVLQAQVGGRILYYSNGSGSPTGTAFLINTGGGIRAMNSAGNAYIAESAMPGSVAGINQGGFFNNDFRAATIGYDTGIGGTVTQITSITTPVTINKICGQITTVSNAWTAGTLAAFPVLNSMVGPNDVIIVTQGNGAHAFSATPCLVISGGFTIVVDPLATVTEAAVLNFAVIKGSNN